MKDILLFALTLFVFVNSTNCPKFICSNKPDNEKPCAIWGLKDIKMAPCSGGKICPMPKGFGDETYCIRNRDYRNLYPGEHCEKSSQCLGGTVCKKEFCRLKKTITMKCNSNIECDTESFCLNGYCENAKKIGKKCNNTTPCQTNGFCSNNICLSLGSVEDGKEAKFAAQCKSFYMENGKCKSGPTLVKGTKAGKEYECVKNTCTYEVKGSGKFYTACTCSKSDSGDLFCPPGLGDLDLDDLADYLNSDERDKCHLDEGPFCFTREVEDMNLEQLKAYKVYIEMTQPSVFFDMSKCVKDTYYSNYFRAKEAIKNYVDFFGRNMFIAISIISGIAITIMLVLYFLKRRKSEISESLVIENDI